MHLRLARKVAAGLLVLPALLLSACETGSGIGQGEEGNMQVGRISVKDTVVRGVRPGGRTLVVDSYSGSITLQGNASSNARLTFTKRARGGTREDAREQLNEITIEESGNDERYDFEVRSGAPDRTRVDIAGSVPQSTRLRINMRNGSVALSGLSGPLRVKNENGNVRIGGAGTTTRAETRNGQIEVGMQRLPADAAVRLRTSNGKVALTLPGRSSARVEAQTEAGAIRNKGLRFRQQDLEQQNAGALFTGRLGSGEQAAPVRLRTSNGNITLREGTVLMLPDIEQGASADTTRPDRAAPTRGQRDTIPRTPSRSAPPRSAPPRSDTSGVQPPLAPPSDTV